MNKETKKEIVWKSKFTGKSYLQLPDGRIDIRKPIEPDLSQYTHMGDTENFNIWAREIPETNNKPWLMGQEARQYYLSNSPAKEARKGYFKAVNEWIAFDYTKDPPAAERHTEERLCIIWLKN